MLLQAGHHGLLSQTSLVVLDPTPSVIGRPVTTQDITGLGPADASENLLRASVSTFPDGLFASTESMQTYLSRRRWFLKRAQGDGGVLDNCLGTNSAAHLFQDGIDEIRMANSSSGGRLDAHGISPDRQAYRRRREWYQQQIDPQQEQGDTLVLVAPDENRAGTNPNMAIAAAHGRRALVELVRACCIIILAPSGWFSSSAFLDQICKEYGVGRSEASLLTVAVNVGFTIGATVSGVMQIPDRIVAARLVAFGSLVAALTYATLAMGFPFGVLVFARCLSGLAMTMVYPILMRYVAGWFPDASRGRALACVIGSLTASVALPHLLKALFPFAPWRVVTFATAAFAFLAACITHGMDDGPHVRRPPGFSIEDVKRVLCNSSWCWVTLSYVGHNLELFGGWAWMGVFLQNYFSLLDGGVAAGESQASLAWLAPAATFGTVGAGCFGAVIGGYLADRVGRCRLIAGVHITSGVAIAALPTVSKIAPPFLVLTVAGIWGATSIADSAQYSALLPEVLPDKRLMGTAITLSTGIGFFSTAIGIYIVPLVLENGGWDWAFRSLALGPALGLVSIVMVARNTATPRGKVDSKP